MNLMHAALTKSSIQPLVIFLTHRELTFSGEMYIQPKVIKIPKGKIPSEADYAEFKTSVFEFLFSNPMNISNIGVCSAHGDDICLYMIGRWLIEEKSFRPSNFLQQIQLYHRMSINKEKYLVELELIYGEKLVDDSVIDKYTENIEIAMNSTVSAAPEINSIPENYQEIPQNTNSPNSNLILVETEDEKLVKQDSPIDPIIKAVGCAIDPNDENKVRRDIINEIGEIKFRDPISLNRGSFSMISNDEDTYCIMEQKKGLRVLALLTQGYCYFVGENNFVRVCTINFPSPIYSAQQLGFTIIEGVLWKASSTPRVQFTVCDILCNEGTATNNLTFHQRITIVDRIFFLRQQVMEKNPEAFKFDEVDVHLRKFYRLKYLSYVRSTMKESSSILFTKPNSTDGPFLDFKENVPPIVTVKVYIMNGEAFGVVGDLNHNVVSFTPFTKSLLNLDNALIDIYYDAIIRRWMILGLSSASKPTDFEVFNKIVSTCNKPPINIETLTKKVNKLLEFDQYVREENERAKQRNQT